MVLFSTDSLKKSARNNYSLSGLASDVDISFFFYNFAFATRGICALLVDAEALNFMR